MKRCGVKHDWQDGKCANCGTAQCNEQTVVGHRCMFRAVIAGGWSPEVWARMDAKKCLIHQPKEK